MYFMEFMVPSSMLGCDHTAHWDLWQLKSSFLVCINITKIHKSIGINTNTSQQINPNIWTEKREFGTNEESTWNYTKLRKHFPIWNALTWCQWRFYPILIQAHCNSDNLSHARFTLLSCRMPMGRKLCKWKQTKLPQLGK